jgi:hypothetical protein
MEVQVCIGIMCGPPKSISPEVLGHGVAGFKSIVVYGCHWVMSDPTS